MNAEEFAKEFITDLDEILKNQHKKGLSNTFCNMFSQSVYVSDPNLKILKKELNKVGYNLELEKPQKKEHDQCWKIVKI